MFTKRDYIIAEFCDVSAESTTSGANPASAHSAPSLMAASTTSLAKDIGRPNTLALRSFHSVQEISKSTLSKIGWDPLSMRFRC